MLVLVQMSIGPVTGIRYLKSFERSSTDPHWLRANLAVHRAQRAALLAAGSPLLYESSHFAVVLSYRRDVIVSLWVLVLQRSERLQRVGQLLNVLVFVPATLPVVWNVAKYPLRGLSRGLAAQQRFPLVNRPKHHSPLCFAARFGTARGCAEEPLTHCITGGRVIIGIKGEPLATDIIGEQTFNVGKTDEE